MNILVTGALGHIGSRLIRHFAQSSAVETVRILDNLSTDRYCSLFDLPQSLRYEFVEGDVRDSERVGQCMENMDAVIHLAAITNAPETIGSRAAETFEVNFGGTELVLAAAGAAKVRHLIFVSTTSVYGPMDGVASETTPREGLRPQSPYAEAKLKAEEEVLNAHTPDGLATTVLRFGTIFGTSPGMRFHTAVNRFIFQACTGLPLTVWENALDQMRPYLDLMDAVNALAFALENPRIAGKLYNAVTLNATVREIVAAIRKCVPELEVIQTPHPMLNQVSYVVDGARFVEAGFRYQGSLEESVNETVALLGKLRPGTGGSSGR